jgi:hypothetical protein
MFLLCVICPPPLHKGTLDITRTLKDDRKGKGQTRNLGLVKIVWIVTTNGPYLHNGRIGKYQTTLGCIVHSNDFSLNYAEIPQGENWQAQAP